MKKVILIVLDGYGIAPPGPGNAITLAAPSHIDTYLSSYPSTTLIASGEAVGLPPHEVGSTEVGHINMGAGKVVYQDLPRINMSIADGSFYKNPAFLGMVEHLKQTGGSLHLLGLIGEGYVHSNLDHLYALLYLARENQLSKVFVHVITDGRDSPPQSAIEVVARLQEKLNQLGVGKIATVVGRYYAMDRDYRWDRTERAYKCLTEGKGHLAIDYKDAIDRAYIAHKTDEFIEPTSIVENGVPVGRIVDNDAVVFFNYRIDRPRQLTHAFVLDNFERDANKSFSFDPYSVKYFKTHHPREEIITQAFARPEKIQNLYFVTMTEYSEGLPAHVAYPPTVVENPLGHVIAESGTAQLRAAESEKERFVTYYFDGHLEQPFTNSQTLIVPSPKVATYDMKPEMSALELTEQLIEKIKTQIYGFVLVNYANADMVGHTGSLTATIAAIKTLDSCISRIVEEAKRLGYTVLITADHGNAEVKINPKTGAVSTEHTASPVPFVVIGEQFAGKKLSLPSGILADIAPTVLELMGIPKPPQMTGRSLIANM